MNVSLINYKLFSGRFIEYEINGNGKGKEYWDNGKLIFEGEYLNGEKNRKRKRI